VIPVFADVPAQGIVAAAAGGAGLASTATAGYSTGSRTHAVAFAKSVREVEDKDLQGINLVRVTSKTEVAPIIKELKSVRGVQYCEPVPARWAATATPVPGTVNPMVNRQWGLRAIHWFDTGLNLDASQVNVAVLDTGVDLSHPDLGSSVIASYDHDGVSEEDIVGHGTHVCGIIAANPKNRVGVTGISNCKIHVWKIFRETPESDGEFYVDELPYLRALRAVQTAGMRVLNLSIAGRKSSSTEQMLFQKLMAAEIVVVSAMGNDYERGNPTAYPAAYGGVVAVGATNETDNRALFSNTGNHIAMSAPGTNILSTLPIKTSIYRPLADQTGYASWNGTSMAAPHVTAAASLLLAAKPRLSARDIIDRLKSTAAAVPAMSGRKRTAELGSGLLDLRAAVN